MPNEASPALDAVAITKHDTNPNAYDAIYVGGTGDVTVTTHKGTLVTFSSVPAGALLPIKTKLVMSTNTTATNMVGLRY